MKIEDKYLPVIESCIRQIEKEYSRLYWNKYQKELEYSLVYNNGASIDFDNFYIHAYSWGKETDGYEPNFK